MNVFNKISKTEGVQLQVPVLFKEDNENANNHYGIISNNEYIFKFSWNSDIEPIIIQVSQNVYSIGIDQHFAVVDLNHNTILLDLNLFYNFYDAKIFNDWLFVITELEIIKVDIKTLKVIGKYALPDFFEEMEFNHRIIEIKCSGGEHIIIK